MMRARTQALVFIIAVLLASWGLELFIIMNGGVRALGPLWIVGLMCIPGLVAVILRLALKDRFADVGLRLGAPGFYALAIGIPILIAALSSAFSIVVDIRVLEPVSAQALSKLMPALWSVLGLGLIGAFGEELGWRGFLLPKLMVEVRHPYALTGIVWAAWHLPLIAFGGFYAVEHRLQMALIYALGIVAMNLVFCELRMRSGSVWVATVAHAAHNFVFQFVVPVLILTMPGGRAKLWDQIVGDTGLIVAALYAGAYLVLHSFSPVPGGKHDRHRRAEAS